MHWAALATGCMEHSTCTFDALKLHAPQIHPELSDFVPASAQVVGLVSTLVCKLEARQESRSCLSGFPPRATLPDIGKADVDNDCQHL
jgi:hypothetical protein